MANPVGFRFRPTDEEIVDSYLLPKNLGSDTSHVDEVISTVDICSFDPWDLPSQSRIKSRDGVWYFFGRKENKYNRGDRQSRKTKSGFWKKTGVTMNVTRKRGNREKIGEKRVLVFHWSKVIGGSKSDWVMHEYHATLSSPTQMVTYTICKVEFKGDETELSSSSGGEIENTHSLIPHMNNSGGLSTEAEEETQLQDAMGRAINGLSTDDWNSLLNDDEQSRIVSMQEDDDATISDEEEWKTWLVDDDEQRNITFMQEDCSDYRPQKPLTGVFIDHSSVDNDSDLTSATPSSFETSSTCDSFGSSNHHVDQIKDLQESPNSTIKLVSLTQEVSKPLGTSIDTSEKKKKNPNDDAQGTEIGEHKLGQETVKNKRHGFFNRMIQKFVKKLHLCSSIYQ